MRGLVLAAVGLTAVGAAAFTPPQARSYAKPTADGRHLLVMLVPKSIRPGAGDALRAKYAQSGLYPAGDTARPVWTCDWYTEFEGGVAASNDAVYAVRVPDRRRNWRQITDPKYRVPPRPQGVDGWPALTVYKGGEVARTFTLGDLFDCGSFTPAECDGGPECQIAAFHDAAGRVTVRTTAGGKEQRRTVDFRVGTVFPVGSGEAVEAVEPAAGENDGAKMRAPGHQPPPKSRERSWAQVVVIGGGVVAGCTTAFLTLAVVLVRGQRGK